MNKEDLVPNKVIEKGNICSLEMLLTVCVYRYTCTHREYVCIFALYIRQLPRLDPAAFLAKLF